MNAQKRIAKLSVTIWFSIKRQTDYAITPHYAARRQFAALD